MKIEIFPLVSKPTGKVKGDEFLAQVNLEENRVKIECYDPTLKVRLEELFSQPIIKIIPVGDTEGVISHKEEAVQPFTEEFFRRILFTLHKLGLYGKFEE